ncbi:MAG: flagellar biosynthetic protein FliR, partial [Gammaproteobacteria bacterium]|nr:flagellar biosynthetic protein FliR [Gammaproteobacteria bacterium]
MEFYQENIMMWLASYIWPYCRIAGMFMVMVAIGSRNMPMRIRLVYSVTVTIAVVPALGPMPEVALFSIES